MVGVGTSGVLGGVWRSPPIALMEFSTSPSELLDFYSLEGAYFIFSRHGQKVLRRAVKAQALRLATLTVSIKHNQVVNLV